MSSCQRPKNFLTRLFRCEYKRDKRKLRLELQLLTPLPLSSWNIICYNQTWELDYSFMKTGSSQEPPSSRTHCISDLRGSSRSAAAFIWTWLGDRWTCARAWKLYSWEVSSGSYILGKSPACADSAKVTLPLDPSPLLGLPTKPNFMWTQGFLSAAFLWVLMKWMAKRRLKIREWVYFKSHKYHAKRMKRRGKVKW